MILNGISIVMNVNNILQIRTLGTEYSRSTQTYSCIFLQHFLITVYRRARVLAQSPSVRWSYQYTSVQTSPMHDLVLLKAALPVLALQFRIPLWQLVLILFARKYVRPFCLQSELSDALCGKKKNCLCLQRAYNLRQTTYEKSRKNKETEIMVHSYAWM